jgi:hypothetical protein
MYAALGTPQHSAPIREPATQMSVAVRTPQLACCFENEESWTDIATGNLALSQEIILFYNDYAK